MAKTELKCVSLEVEGEKVRATTVNGQHIEAEVERECHNGVETREFFLIAPIPEPVIARGVDPADPVEEKESGEGSIGAAE